MDSRDSEVAPESVGLCGTCSHVRIIAGGQGSVYYLCRLSAVDTRFVRYPTLPVTACAGFLRMDSRP